MKIAFVADVHLSNHRRFGGEMIGGLNTRFRQSVAVLDKAIRVAANTGARTLYVLGDLFDSAKPTPQELTAVMEVFDRSEELDVHLMLGNHDQASNTDGDHALGPLTALRNVTVYQHPVAAFGMIVVPFQVGPAREWLPGVVARTVRGSNSRTLLLHMGVADDSTPPFLRGASDSIPVDDLVEIMGAHGIRNAFAGNWHNPQTWRRTAPQGSEHLVTQLGALVPTGFDNPGLDYGHMAILDTETAAVTDIELSGGPRFITAPFEDLDLEDVAATGLRHELYLRVAARPKNVKLAQAALKELQADGKLIAFEVLPDKEAASATAKNTARTTRNATSVNDAVAAYVAKTAMPDGTDRRVVLELVKDYLARG
jgi:hypothetical protein